MKTYTIKIKVPGTYYTVNVKSGSESGAIEEVKKKYPKMISVESIKSK
ncbi:hypothetical protein [Parvicella tangerina]|uniref:Uncharacterized protein n=1 Tax=Parvicella tangerina TaxID=2829795 RepID=A0A916NQU2_9FLAO|nr:hypothetical protein [Parvicella tangerina]CAG5079891.1 hypothetical protein CRYO30217_01110 [Parvicella tangerina]